jgi:ribonuclease HI
VQLVRWSPPIEKEKTKVNTDASISDDGQCSIGFVMFDFRGIHHFRYAKKCISGCLKVNREDSNYDAERQIAICEAEARAIRKAIQTVIDRTCLPADIETDNLTVSAAINGKVHQKKDELSTSFWDIIKDIRKLIGTNDIKVEGISRKQNRAADHVANSARKSTIQDFLLKKGSDELDEKITYETWIAMYGGSKVIISEGQEADNLEIDNVKDTCYVFSKHNHDAQTIKKWIDEGTIHYLSF